MLNFFDCFDHCAFSVLAQYLDGRDAARLSCLSSKTYNLVNNNNALKYRKDSHLIVIESRDQFEPAIASVSLQLISDKRAYALMNAICWFNLSINWKEIMPFERFEIPYIMSDIGDWRGFQASSGNCVMANDYYDYCDPERLEKVTRICNLYKSLLGDTLTWKIIYKPCFTYDVAGSEFHRSLTVVFTFHAGCLPDPTININKYLKKSASIPRYFSVGSGNKRRFIDLADGIALSKEKRFLYELSKMSEK